MEEHGHWVLEKRAGTRPLEVEALGASASVGGGAVVQESTQYLKIPLCRIMQRKGRRSFVKGGRATSPQNTSEGRTMKERECLTRTLHF